MDLWAFSPKYCFLVFGNLTTISMIHNWPTQRPRPWFASQRTAYSLFQQSHNCSYTSWSRGRWKNSKSPKECCKLKQIKIWMVQILQFLLQNKKENNYNWKSFWEGSTKSLRQNVGSSLWQESVSVCNVHILFLNSQRRTCTTFQTLFSEHSTCHLKLCLVWVSRRLSVWKITKVGQTWFLCISWRAIILESRMTFSTIIWILMILIS